MIFKLHNRKQGPSSVGSRETTAVTWNVSARPAQVPLATGSGALVAGIIPQLGTQAQQNVPVLDAAAPGFSLSPASKPFPRNLADKVRSGQFVEMRDLLTDNIALLQQVWSIFPAYLCARVARGPQAPRT